jgi:hypothetical protein
MNLSATEITELITILDNHVESLDRSCSRWLTNRHSQRFHDALKERGKTFMYACKLRESLRVGSGFTVTVKMNDPKCDRN